MASPIGHSFAGLWTFLLLLRNGRPARFAAIYRHQLVPLLVLILLANLPDIDFLFGLSSNPNRWHRGFTHSLLAMTLVSVGLACFWRVAKSFWRSAAIYAFAYGSHLLIDLSTGARLGWNASGYGIPLLWPWRQRIVSPLVLFFGVQHETRASLFSLDNLWAASYELLLFGGITAVVVLLCKPKLKSRTHLPGPGPAHLLLTDLHPK